MGSEGYHIQQLQPSYRWNLPMFTRFNFYKAYQEVPPCVINRFYHQFQKHISSSFRLLMITQVSRNNTYSYGINMRHSNFELLLGRLVLCYPDDRCALRLTWPPPSPSLLNLGLDRHTIFLWTSGVHASCVHCCFGWWCAIHGEWMRMGIIRNNGWYHMISAQRLDGIFT